MVVVLLGVEKERDDVDANALLGSDGRDPLSSATTFILLVVFVWCVRACVMCVYICSE